MGRGVSCPGDLLSGEVVSVGLAILAAVVWLVRLEGRVNAAHAQCADLSKKLDALQDMDVRVARIETRIDGLFEQFKDLNASLRWMRNPAEYEKITRPGP